MTLVAVMIAAVETMRRFSREVRDVRLPALPTASESPLPATYSTVIFAEAFAFHREMLSQYPEQYRLGIKSHDRIGKTGFRRPIHFRSARNGPAARNCGVALIQARSTC